MNGPETDRRCARRRVSVEEHGIVAARVRPGLAVSLIDVSAGGALVETTRRLLPGASVELQLETGQVCVTVRGRVVRCAVAHVRSTSMCYRGAISFDRCLPWFVDDRAGGYSVPAADTRPALAPRADATRLLL